MNWGAIIGIFFSAFIKFMFAPFVSAGVGLRVDFDFFIIRLDLGIPLTNPALPQGSKWIFQSRDAFNQELVNTPGIDLSTVPKPFTPVLSFGIGYPF